MLIRTEPKESREKLNKPFLMDLFPKPHKPFPMDLFPKLHKPLPMDLFPKPHLEITPLLFKARACNKWAGLTPAGYKSKGESPAYPKPFRIPSLVS